MGAKYPESATMMGEQKTVAAIGGANAWASLPGKCIESFSMITGAKRRRPAVAKTESAKPASRACHGSTTTTAAMAKPSAGSESRPFLVPCATSRTAAIAAARSTDGDGRTNAINAMRDIAVAERRNFILANRNCIIHKTNAETSAKLAPLTATK